MADEIGAVTRQQARSLVAALRITEKRCEEDPAVAYQRYCAALTELVRNLDWAERGLQVLDRERGDALAAAKSPELADALTSAYLELGLPEERARDIAVEARTHLDRFDKRGFAKRRGGLYAAVGVGSLRGQVCTLSHMLAALDSNQDGTQKARDLRKDLAPKIYKGMVGTLTFVALTNVYDIQDNLRDAAMLFGDLIVWCSIEIARILELAIDIGIGGMSM